MNLIPPVGYKSLAQERWSVTLILLGGLTLYSFTRFLLLILDAPFYYLLVNFEFMPKWLVASGWFITGCSSVYSIFTKWYLPWRLSFILAAGGFSSWALSFLLLDKPKATDSILTYSFLAATLLIIAVRADDPRAIKRLKEAAWTQENISFLE